MKKTLLVCALGIAAWQIQAQETNATKVQQLDEVVVSDSRFELKRENSGKTVIKIDAGTIEKEKGRTVAQLLQQYGGIEINGAKSSPGQSLGVYIRGGRSKQVLVLIDGVAVYDPSGIDNNYDLRVLQLQQIESIEIVKGAASTLYGSGAATAVILIKTKKASQKEIALQIHSSIGTSQTADDQDYDLNSFVQGAQLSGTVDKFNYKMAINSQSTDGFSAANTENDERDVFTSYGVDLNLGYRFSEQFHLNVFGNLSDSKGDFDAGAFADANNQYVLKQKRAGLQTAYNYGKGSVHLQGAFSEFEREFRSAFPSEFDSDNVVVDVYNKYRIADKWHTIVGLNYQKSKTTFAEKESFEVVDPYANVVYVSDFGLNVNAGARWNNHSDYGSHFTYSLNPSYTLKNNGGYLKFFASYATSYIVPSLSQLYGQWGANPDLEPEEAVTIEGGMEKSFGSALRLSALYFNRVVDPMIQWQGDGYVNLEEELSVRGVEIEANGTYGKWQYQANYTFSEAVELDYTRIPKHKANLNLGYDLLDHTKLSLAYQYTHDRTDQDFTAWPASIVNLDAYHLLGIQANHTLMNQKLNLFVALDNLLNESFVEIYGYNTMGRNIRFGFQLQL
ncbi:MAG: TonB-dependent receptor [Flavobacteriaceae bacterium]|nr:TonB-dependent receptor [Flavobacteriaceae bacterium]